MSTQIEEDTTGVMAGSPGWKVEALPDPCQKRDALLTTQCEGFFGRVKNEVFYGRDWKGRTLDDFMYFIDRYLNWFRNERIKIGLNNKNPKEYRTGLGLAL